MVKLLADYHGMSGNETDHRVRNHIGNRQYAIVNPSWRHPTISRWLRVFDKVYLSTRFHGNGRARAGNWSRIRHQSGRTDPASLPVPGLPRNFYDPGFLTRLSPEGLKDLNIQPPVDLHLSDRVMA